MNKIKFLVSAALVFMVCFHCGAAAAVQCKRPPLPEALDALNSSSSVEVSVVTVDSWDNSSAAPSDDNIYYAFKPKGSVPRTGFIILPGGNCDPRSYAPAAHALAKKGFLTCIIPMPSCIAIFGYGRSDKVMQDRAGIEQWAVGGHSIGGTSAGIYAAQNTAVSGVVIWASLPDPANSLAASPVKVLSVYGSQDGRVPPEKILEYAAYLPTDTVYVEIPGGNHTQFGWIDPSPDLYLKDPDDKLATISLEQQQEKIVKATADFLLQLDTNACPVISLFGSKDARTLTVARFRDEVLSKTAAGRGIIAGYKKAGAKAVEIFKRHPSVKRAAAIVLEALMPALELAL